MIFIWAYILAYIKQNPHTTLASVTLGSKLTKYLVAALDVIKPNDVEGAYQYVFEKLLGEDKIRFASQEYISDRIVEAYKIIEQSKEVKKDETTAKDEIQIIIKELSIDPIFQYAASTYGKPNADTESDISKILGINLAELVKKTTKTDHKITNLFAKLYEPSGKDVEQLFKKEYDAERAYLLFAKYIKDESHVDPFRKPDQKTIAEIHKEKELDKIRVAETRKSALKAWAIYQKASSALVYKPDIAKFPNSYIYDENGIKHKWDNSWPPKCKICGITTSDFRKLDEKKVNISRALTAKFKMFFGFYETRCPIGGLHLYTESSGKCSKCGVTEKIVKNPMSDVTASTEYYDIHKVTLFDVEGSEFQTIQAESEQLTTESDNFSIIPFLKRLDTYPTIMLKEYSYKFARVKALATLSGISIHTLEAFGRFENRSMKDIESGAHLLSPTIANVIGAYAIFRLLWIDYYSLKNYYSFSKPPHELKTIIEATPDFQAELKKLPDFDLDKYRLDSLSETNPPALAYQFIIESIADMCIKIAESSQLGKSFVTGELKKLVKTEKLLSKPGPFNMMLFTQEDDLSLGTDEGDPDVAAEADEDVSAQIDEQFAENKLTDYDPVGYEEMDYDGSNDNKNDD